MNDVHPLLPRPVFLKIWLRYALFALIMLTVCLGIGMVGYHHYEVMSWMDAFGNASMILSGMGPLDRPKTVDGTFFAGCYALFSGVVFLTTVGLFLAPVASRVFHKFHLTVAKHAEQAKEKK